MEKAIRVELSPLFEESYSQYLKNYPKIKNKIMLVRDFKSQIPPRTLPSGMKDHMLQGNLKGFMECHLSQNILLIYTLNASILKLIIVCDHDDLYHHEKKIKKYLN
jgi:mRNA interferase YafQ